jgi:hypothetical protein
MATTAQWGAFEWGEAEWGSVEADSPRPPTAVLTLAGAAPLVLPVRLQPGTGILALMGAAPVVTLSSSALVPIVGSLALIGAAPLALQSAAIRPPAGALAFLGLAPALTKSFLFEVQWDADVAMRLLLLLDWEVGPAPAIVGGVLPLEWSLDELLERLRLDWDVYQIGLEAAYDEDPQRPWARVNAL